jgi:hypothetical protein
MSDMRRYLAVSFPYLVFTLTDGALRIITVLVFHRLGFSPFQIASLFILYEISGIFTNFLGDGLGHELA